MSDEIIVPLSDGRYFSFISGLWKGKKRPFQTAAVLRSTNFRGDGLFSYEDIALLDVEERQLASRELQHGDIVIERSGGGPKQPVGRVAYFDPPDDLRYSTSNFTTTLRVVDKSVFDPEYVCLFLHSLYLSGATETLQRATTGIRNLDWGEYQQFKIPRLDIEDQKTVAALLKRTQDVALNEDAQSLTLRDLKRAAMAKLFTCGLKGEVQKETDIGPVPESWDVATLGSLGRIGSGTTPDRKNSNFWRGGSIPWVTSGRMYEREINGSDVCVTALAIEYSSLPMLKPGAVLIAIVGQGKTLGHCAILGVEATVSRHVGFVQPDQAVILPAYLRGYLESQYDYLRQLASGNGSTRAALTGGILKSILIPLPPTIDEQQEIVTILDAIDCKIDLHKQKRVVLDELFKSLLHKLMTDEIRVADLDLSALDKKAVAV